MPVSRGSSALLIAALAASAGASTCALAPDVARGPAEAFAIRGMGFELFLGLLAFAGAALSDVPPSLSLGLRAGRLPPLRVALLVIATVALSHALDTVVEIFRLGEHGSIAQLESTLTGVRGRALALALFGIGIAPGLAEELFCRGLLQRGLVPAVGAPAAVTLAAAFFGALHLDLVHATFAGLLGLYLGTVCHLAGSVRPAMLCHAVNNICAVLMASWLPAPGIPPALSIAVGGGFALAALAWVWRRAGPPPPLYGSRDAASAAAAQLDATDGGRIGRL